MTNSLCSLSFHVSLQCSRPMYKFGRFFSFTLTLFKTLRIFCLLLRFLPVSECQNSKNSCGCLGASEPTEVLVSA
jgi:hypothetical protein